MVASGFILAAAAAVALDPALARLVEQMEDIRQAHDVAAVGFVLVSADEVLHSGALGVEDRETGVPATADTVFRIGSITKTFTGLALLLAQEDGSLSLDDAVAQHLDPPPFTNPWEKKRPVRVAHLLEHTAGFSDLTQAEFRISDPRPASLAESLAFAPESRTAHWPPGLHSSYSNSGAGVAAAVLEQRTRRSYESFVTARIFEPLGMSSAGFFLDEDTRARLATGYDNDGHKVIPYWHMIYRAFGGINVSPRDMAPFLQLLLNDGISDGRRLLPAAAIARLERPRTTLAARAGLEWGYGLGNYYWSRDGFIWHGHGGDGDGYLAHYGYNRAAQRGYFVVINAFNHDPLRALRATVEQWLQADAMPPDVTPVATLSEEQLARYAGLYEEATHRFAWSNRGSDRLKISVAEGRLYTRFGSGPRRPLLPVSEQHFRRPHEPRATAAFLTGPDGELFLQGGMGNYRRVEPRS